MSVSSLRADVVGEFTVTPATAAPMTAVGTKRKSIASRWGRLNDLSSGPLTSR